VPFTLNPPTSNSSGAFSYSSSDPTVASIVGNVVTVVKAGTITITATQAAATNYTYKTVTASFVVNPIAPTFGSFNIDSRNFGTLPFTLNPPTSNSSGAFSYTSGNTDVATVGSTTGVVTIVSAGTTPITVTQAAAGNYTSRSIGADFVVNPIIPTLGSFSISPRDFGIVPFSILPNTHTVLYIRNGGSDWKTKVANNDTSNTNLHAWAGIDKQWFDLNYGEVNEVALQFRFFAAYVTKFYNITSASCAVVSAYGNIGTYSFTFNGGTSYTGTFNGQVQSWDYTLPADFTVNRNSLQPSSNSLGVFSYASNNIAVASIVGNQVTVVGAGTAGIMAQQAAAGNYTTSLTIFHSFVVNKISPTINFSIAPREFGSGEFTLTSPSSNSSGAFSYTSSKPEVATVGSTTGVVTIVSAGTTLITVTQAETTNYTSKSIGVDFVVNRFTTILSNFSPPSILNRNTQPFTLPQPTSNRPGAFIYTSSNTSVATVNSITGLVTILGGGTTQITLTQAETQNYTLGIVTSTMTVFVLGGFIGSG
jgi:uncharacterized protein YjdB